MHIDQYFGVLSVTVTFLQHQRDGTFHRRISTVMTRKGTETTDKFEKNSKGFGERLGRREESHQGRYSFGRSARHSRIGPLQIFGEVPGLYHLPELVEAIKIYRQWNLQSSLIISPCTARDIPLVDSNDVLVEFTSKFHGP